jgi:PAS domain S-box-containing protein
MKENLQLDDTLPAHPDETTSQRLRRRAEQLLALGQGADAKAFHDLQSLVQELSIHQIELELQGQELRKANEELTAARELYFEHFLTAPLPIFRISALGVVVDANLSGLDFLGVDAVALKKRRILLFENLSPLASRQWKNFREAMVELGIEQEVRLEVASPSGSKRILRITGRIIRPPSEAEDPAIILYLKDITEQESAIEEVRRLSLIAERTTNGVLFTTPDRKITHVNAGFTQITGYTLGEVIGKNPSFLQGPETDPETVSRIREKLDARCEVREDILNYAKDGNPYWIRLEIHPYHDSEGRFLGFFSLQADLTDILTRENSLAALRTAIENSPATVVITDLESRIIYVNPAFEKITGYSAEEAIEKFPSILKSGEQDDAFYDGLWAQLNGGKIWEGIFRNRRKDGGLYWEEAAIAPIFDHRGQKTGYIAVKQDITARKEAELALEQANRRLTESESYAREMARRATVASRAKSGFLANMSHEIRTPLGGIIGLSELLLDSDLKEEQRTFAKAILGGGETLLGLLNDVLDLSKIEAGKMELRDDPFSLKDILESVTQLMEPNARHHGLKMRVMIDGEAPNFLRGDPLRLKQVLNNLVSNSIKFTRAGEICISATCIHSEKTKHTFRFSVSDTGVGIPLDRQDSIFEEFVQVESQRHRHPGGTGLGLPICKRLTKLMGGQISLTSPLCPEDTEAPGTRIDFTAIFFEDAQALKAQPDDPGGRETKVLVVEDNLTNWTVAELMLRKLGLSNITLAIDGAKALELLQGQTFDLVFMDMRLPELNGCEVTRRLRASSDFQTPADTPVIALTAGAREEDKRACLDSGMNAHVAKPLNLKTLQEAIRSLRSP